MIRVNIGQLVLDGVEVPPLERPGLQASIERELGALLAQDQASGSFFENGEKTGRTGGAVPEVRGGTLKAEGKLANRIAHSVYGAISR